MYNIYSCKETTHIYIFRVFILYQIAHEKYLSILLCKQDVRIYTAPFEI